VIAINQTRYAACSVMINQLHVNSESVAARRKPENRHLHELRTTRVPTLKATYQPRRHDAFGFSQESLAHSRVGMHDPWHWRLALLRNFTHAGPPDHAPTISPRRCTPTSRASSTSIRCVSNHTLSASDSSVGLRPDVGRPAVADTSPRHLVVGARTSRSLGGPTALLASRGPSMRIIPIGLATEAPHLRPADPVVSWTSLPGPPAQRPG
jgi:hypothetical protein